METLDDPRDRGSAPSAARNPERVPLLGPGREAQVPARPRPPATGSPLRPSARRRVRLAASPSPTTRPIRSASASSPTSTTSSDRPKAAACSTRRSSTGSTRSRTPPSRCTASSRSSRTDPDWLDWEQVELGAKVFRRWGTAIFSFATTSTLEMYSESSIAKPLALTGGYTGERAHKRQMETVRFWIDVSDPGGLRPGMRGRATAMRVRVMHVFIRRRLVKHPEWDLDAWGVPISVSDATLTLMGGSVVPGLALWSRRPPDDDPRDRGHDALLALRRPPARRAARRGIRSTSSRVCG